MHKNRGGKSRTSSAQFNAYADVSRVVGIGLKTAIYAVNFHVARPVALTTWPMNSVGFPGALCGTRRKVVPTADRSTRCPSRYLRDACPANAVHRTECYERRDSLLTIQMI